MPISSITAAAATLEPSEPPDRPDPDQEGARATRSADVAQRLSGEGLPADHREDADAARYDRDHAAKHSRQRYGGAREEARLDDALQHRVHGDQKAPWSWWCGCDGSASSLSPATTITRLFTRSTSTRWPYRRLSTSDLTTSSAVPLAARPSAR